MEKKTKWDVLLNTPPNINTIIEELVAYMRRLKTNDVPLQDKDEQRAYNQGWDCATDYSAEKLRTSLQSLGSTLVEEIEKRKRKTDSVLIKDKAYTPAELMEVCVDLSHNASKDEEIQAIKRIFGL